MGARIGRELGALESVVDLIDRARSLNFVVMADLRGTIDPAALRAALDRAQAIHPLLRVRIDRADAKARFTSDRVGPVPLEIVERGVDASAVATAEMNRPLPREVGPLARCVWLRGDGERSTLMLTFNHTIGDGRAGACLLGDVLALLGGRRSLSPLPMPSPLEARIPAASRGARGLWRFLGFVARQVGGSLARGGFPRRVRRERAVPVEAVEARLVSRAVDRALLERLTARARAQETSVHGALGAALLLAYLRCEEGGRTRVLGLGSPVDLRRRMDPPVGDEVGLFVALAQSSHRVRADTPFWALARETRGQLAAGIERGDPLCFAPVVGWLVPRLSWLLGGAEAPRKVAAFAGRMIDATSAITNLGVLDLPRDQGALELERVQFVVSPSAMADLVTTAATFDGVLSWNFVHNAPRVSAARVEALADAALSALRAAVE